MKNEARGYIASGEFNGNRLPQHLQNQIVKSYCEANNLEFILSRAEYWINGSTQCQLWAALKEGFEDIVFFSVWQLPNLKEDREKIYEFCIRSHIILHFAVERIRIDPRESSLADFEMLIQSNLVMLQRKNYHEHLVVLKDLIYENDNHTVGK